MVTYQFFIQSIVLHSIFSNGAEELPSSASFYIHRLTEFERSWHE
jgi:hypothetical protein